MFLLICESTNTQPYWRCSNAHFLTSNLVSPSLRTQRSFTCKAWMSLGSWALVRRRVTFSHQNKKSAGSRRFFVNNNVCLFQGAQFNESNTNLSLWQASLSSSYMCNKEQNCSINGNLNIVTFSLRVQPFAVKDGVFNTGRWCSETTQHFCFFYTHLCGIAEEKLCSGHLEDVIQKASSVQLVSQNWKITFRRDFVIKMAEASPVVTHSTL